MKPPHQNRPGNRGPGSGGPRRPGAPNDGQQHTRPGGPRPDAGAKRAAGQAPGATRFGRTDAPRGGPRTDTQRPREDHPPRPEHRQRPARKQDTEVPSRRFEPRVERPAVAAPRPGAAAPRTTVPAADAPRGTVWLYGLHAVGAALANPGRRLRRLLLTEEAEAALGSRQRQPLPLAHERVERGRLDHLLGRDTTHQGAALLADLLVPPALAQVLERPGPLLVLDQVTDPRNVGAILRSAQAFGAAAVIVQERNAPEETGSLAKAASGALETVPLLRAVNLARTLVALKAGGCWVIGLDASGAPLSGAALAERRVALVLGSEGEGLRRLTRDTCDELGGIAMPGSGAGLDSLNVSAVAAIALYEMTRRS